MVIGDWMWLLTGQLIGGAGVMLALWGLLADRMLGGRGKRRCARCWYDLSAVQGLRCPECGRRARSERGVHRSRVRRWAVVLGVVVLMPLGLAAAAWPLVRVGWPSVLTANQLALIWWIAPQSNMGERASAAIKPEELNAKRWGPRLSRIIASGDAVVGARAIQWLPRMELDGGDYKPMLLTAMKDPLLERDALVALGRIYGDDAEVVEMLMNAVRGGGPAASSCAVVLARRTPRGSQATARLALEGHDPAQLIDRMLRGRNAAQPSAGSEAVLNVLALGLSHPAAEVRKTALSILVRNREALSTGVAEALTWMLDEEDADMRRQAEQLLSQISTEAFPGAIYGLAWQLRYGSARARDHVMGVLWYKDVEADGPLLGAMIEATADPVLSVATRARQVLSDPRAPVHEHLLRMTLDDPRCEVAASAAYALTRRGCSDLRTFNRLCEIADDPGQTAEIRRYADAAAMRWNGERQ